MSNEIIMPDDGRDFRTNAQEAICQFCGPIRHEFIYQNDEAIDNLGMTAEDFALLVHLHDEHFYNEATETWEK
jgi:hypothetical protein